jgi:hypothetical protein
MPCPCPVCHQLHRERAVTGRIFQALPNFCSHRQTFCPHRQTPCLLLYIRCLNFRGCKLASQIWWYPFFSLGANTRP